MIRDQRDPQALGESLLALRGRAKLSTKYDRNHGAMLAVPAYKDDGFISSRPWEHHSQTPQTVGNLDDGGAS